MACKSSRERKQQIKTVPFMMAARRTLIDTQTIYTAAGRSKGTQGRGGGPRSVGPAGGVEGTGKVGGVLCARGAAGVTTCQGDATGTSSCLSFLERLQLRL